MAPLTSRTKNKRALAAEFQAEAWPSFSVVVPTYERRDIVSKTVRTLGAISYQGAIELIVVVDGSTDGTAEALRAIELPFPLEIFEQANAGAAAARNAGAALARNEVILFLDDDMVAAPDLLTEHARLHREGADAVIGETPIHPRSPEGFLARSVSRWTTSRQVQSPLSPFDIFTGQLSVRRELFRDLGGFDTGLTSGGAFGNEDAEFGVRLLADHDVRHNPAARSEQFYVVSPREYMSRALAAAAADARFVRKHPELTRELFERKGYSRPLTRFIYRPLARIPGLPVAISRFAVAVADAAQKTSFRSSRIVARFFSGARSIAYWSALRRTGWLPMSDRLLVLCYHAIEDQFADPVLAPYGVPPEQFGAQLDSLTKRGFTFITPGHFAAYLQSNAPLPRRAVLLTFDDGYASLTETARADLKPRDIEAIVFSVTGPGTNEWDQAVGANAVSLLSAKDRRTLEALGFEVGSHSRTHREMPLLGPVDLAEEAAGSLHDLRAGGHNPRFFAYPYGARDVAACTAVKSAGYLAAFSTRHRHVRPDDDSHDLPRVMIYASDRGWRFRAKTAAPRLWVLVQRIRRRIGL
jgi:glycosyltransferase involved in cell wall biosynthesis/peptidoglycan/xylan/chitin deacetylase (PgdA/CDA1 family)